MAPMWHIQDGQDGRGRRVIADKGFKAGDVVLEDDAAAWCLISDRLSQFCDCCLAPIDHPLRCSACKTACYLDREHQRRAWQAGAHRLECAALRSCAPHVPPTAVRLALRCVLRDWHASSTTAPPASGHRYSEVLGLVHHWEELQDAAKVECAQMGAAAHSLLRAAAPDAASAVSVRDLALLIARFGCNSHTISDDELQPVAVGIFPLGAMVNHSCHPNTVHAFRGGGRIVFRAVRTIQPGEEVTTSYTELAATRWERRAALLEHHLFDIDGPGAAADSSPHTAAPAAAGPATGASGTAVGGRQQQQARVQAVLRCEPQQQPTAEVVLAGSAAHLSVYRCQQTPWRHDERDSWLTAVVLAGGAGAKSDSWGGMWGCRQPVSGASGASAAAACLESFGVEGQLGGVSHSTHAAQGLGSQTAGESERGSGMVAIHSWFPDGFDTHKAAVEQLARRYAAALQLQQGLDGLLASGKAAAAVQQLRDTLQGLSPGGAASGSAAGAAQLVLGPCHVLRMRLLADLHRAALAAEDWSTALATARQLLPLHQQAYQEVWPQPGLLWASVAKLENLSERPSAALAAAQAATRILECTHGSGSAVVRGMQRIEFEASTQQQQQQLRVEADRGEDEEHD
ncbi:Histone-lysine N-methyltransferase [Chlorella vulgaris]